MEYIIGYVAVGAIVFSAYYGNLLRQRDIKKVCGAFHDVYYDFKNKFYPNPALVTLSVNDEGVLLPIESQPMVLQEILNAASSYGDIKEYYDNLNNSFEAVRKAIGKSVKNDKHYLYPLFEILNVAAAFYAGVEDYSKLNDPAFMNNFNIFLNKQDKIKEVLEARMLSSKK